MLFGHQLAQLKFMTSLPIIIISFSLIKFPNTIHKNSYQSFFPPFQIIYI